MELASEGQHPCKRMCQCAGNVVLLAFYKYPDMTTIGQCKFGL